MKTKVCDGIDIVSLSPNSMSRHCWYVRDGITVGYTKVMLQSVDEVLDFLYEGEHVDFGADENELVLLCDIEVRDGYRNQGISKLMMEEIRGSFNVPFLYHQGGYTPDGFEYVHKNVSYIGTEPTHAEFRQMNFVSTWDTRELVFPY